jgi:hypothetical protein
MRIRVHKDTIVAETHKTSHGTSVVHEVTARAQAPGTRGEHWDVIGEPFVVASSELEQLPNFLHGKVANG